MGRQCRECSVRLRQTGLVLKELRTAVHEWRLCPPDSREILTKDENWINRHDLFDRFEESPVLCPISSFVARSISIYFDS